MKVAQILAGVGVTGAVVAGAMGLGTGVASAAPGMAPVPANWGPPPPPGGPGWNGGGPGWNGGGAGWNGGGQGWNRGGPADWNHPEWAGWMEQRLPSAELDPAAGLGGAAGLEQPRRLVSPLGLEPVRRSDPRHPASVPVPMS